MNANDITRVECRWDDQDCNNEGWYCETWCEDEFCDDSQKIWFPVQVDEFDGADGKQLREALAEAFRNAEILIS